MTMVKRPSLRSLAVGLSAGAALLALAACHLDAPAGKERLEFALKDSLDQYDSLEIVIVDAQDTTLVLETLFQGRLNPGEKLPSHELKEAQGKDFILRIVGFEDGVVAYRNNVVRSGDGLQANVVPESQLPIAKTYSALSGITHSAGKPSKVFNKDTLNFTVEVGYGDSSFTFTPKAVSPKATMTIDGVTMPAENPSKTMDLAVGANKAEVVVQSPDGSTRRYIVTIIRAGTASPNAFLRDLSLSTGPLNPGFAKDTADYRVYVTGGGRTLTLSAAAENRFAWIAINSHAPVRGGAVRTLALQEGTNLISIKVIGEDTTSVRHYSISVTLPPSSVIDF